MKPNIDMSRLPLRSSLTAPARLTPGLCIQGHLTSETGVGEAARLISQAADAKLLELSFMNHPLPGRDHEHHFRTKINQTSDRTANLFVFGLLAADIINQANHLGRFNIFYPFWELPRCPERLCKSLNSYDEIWAPTEFVAAALRQSVQRSVIRIPTPVRTPNKPPAFRRNGDVLTVFSFFDTDSFVARKNPLAALTAFRAAFPPSQLDVRMVMKVRGLTDTGERALLFRAASEDPRISIIDRTLSRAEMNLLMMRADIFLSLHRSEGFGLGPAEALACGKIVVATDFGGTRDFINDETGFPISYEMVDVKAGSYPDSEGQSWAEPSLEHAIATLRNIQERPEFAFARAEQGFDRLKQEFSFNHIGGLMRDRLSELDLLR